VAAGVAVLLLLALQVHLAAVALSRLQKV